MHNCFALSIAPPPSPLHPHLGKREARSLESVSNEKAGRPSRQSAECPKLLIAISHARALHSSFSPSSISLRGWEKEKERSWDPATFRLPGKMHTFSMRRESSSLSCTKIFTSSRMPTFWLLRLRGQEGLGRSSKRQNVHSPTSRHLLPGAKSHVQIYDLCPP